MNRQISPFRQAFYPLNILNMNLTYFLDKANNRLEGGICKIREKNLSESLL